MFQNDELLGEGSFTPEYRMTRPNGPGCDPVCTMAPSDVLVLEPGLGDPSALP